VIKSFSVLHPSGINNCLFSPRTRRASWMILPRLHPFGIGLKFRSCRGSSSLRTEYIFCTRLGSWSCWWYSTRRLGYFFFCRYKSILTESQNLITENFAIWDLGDNIQQYAAFDELNQCYGLYSNMQHLMNSTNLAFNHLEFGR
jgi:hypothetical protein